MRLEYRILCIDDDISSLEGANGPKERLIRINNSVGISTVFIDIPVLASARETQKAFRDRMAVELEKKYEENNSFDLILIDLHMQDEGEGIEDPIGGADFVSMVRNHTMYKPIVFYSGGIPSSNDKAMQQLESALKDVEMWGRNAMLCPRNDLPQFLERLAEQMHEEEHKISYVRGLLMDSVSEIEAKIIYKLRTESFWGDIPPEKREKILCLFKKRMRRKANLAKDTLNSIEEIDFAQMKAFFQDDAKDRETDMNIKSEILRTALEFTPGMSESGSILSTFYNGEHCLATTRNLYAHKTAKEILLNHTKDKLKLIREDSKKHLKNLSDLCGNES